MLHTAETLPSTVKYPCHIVDTLHASLGTSEVGAVVLDESGGVLFMNDAARALLQAPDGDLPLWTLRHVRSILSALAWGRLAIERWEHGNLLLRVQAKSLGQLDCTVLAIDIARTPTDHAVASKLSRSLHLRRSEAEVLELVWRGRSDEEIAAMLGVGMGRLRARLASLYRKLDVELRPAAALRAAKALAA